MLTTALQLITAGMIGQFTFGQPIPLDTDLFKAPPGEKRVMLAMDVSFSMSWGDRPTPCAWYDPLYEPDGVLNKNEQMKTAAVGCNFPHDGFLGQWASQ